MIAILTGATASGKTDTGWALLARHSHCVFLESDALTSKRPFDHKNESDLMIAWEQIIVNINCHRARGVSHFIITISPQMAALYPQIKTHLERLEIPCHAFRLVCREDEALRRIAQRGRGEEQEARERQWISIHNQVLDARFPDDSLFIGIYTTNDDERTIAGTIMKRIG